MKTKNSFIHVGFLILLILILVGLVSCKLECAEDQETKEITIEKMVENTSERLDDTSEEDTSCIPREKTYILNIKSKKIHKTTCGTGDLISPENRRTYKGDVDDLFEQGYTLCGNCYK